MSAADQKASRILLGIFAAYAVLCATHRGEFWPFSIYPMFSRAGHTWSRVVVRQVPPGFIAAEAWAGATLDGLPGQPLPLDHYGIPLNDLATFVATLEPGNTRQADVLRRLFRNVAADDRSLVVYHVEGRLAADGAVVVVCRPVAYVLNDTASTLLAQAAHVGGP